MTMRYEILEGSPNHGCCFDMCIVDTTKPVLDRLVCECLGRDVAEKIAAALRQELREARALHTADVCRVETRRGEA